MMVRGALLLALLVIAVATVTVVLRQDPPQPPLMVHAGAGLRPALDRIGGIFEELHGVRVDYNYKGSGCLLPDVMLSGRGDAYIPGELYYMDQALDRGLIEGHQVVARMTSVLAVQAGNPRDITAIADLTRPGLRVGIADPEAVAVGRAARELLEAAGLWDDVRQNIVMTALNVTELGTAIKMKQVDAVILWDATADLFTEEELHAIELPAEQAVIAPVPAAALTVSRQPDLARTYVDFLSTPAARDIFVDAGFGVPVPAPAISAPGALR